MKNKMRRALKEVKKIFDRKKLYLLSIGVLSTIIAFFLDQYVVMLMMLLRNDFLVSLFSIITLVGNVEVFIPFAIIISVFLYAKKRKLLGLWASIISAAVLSFLIKSITNRPRPYQTQNIASLINTSMSSFPSGHSMIMFAMVPVLSKNFPKGKYYFLCFAALIAFTRIYLDVHYLSDVVAGGFLGYIVGMVCTDIAEREIERGDPA